MVEVKSKHNKTVSMPSLLTFTLILNTVVFIGNFNFDCVSLVSINFIDIQYICLNTFDVLNFETVI